VPGLGTSFGRGGATTFQQDLQNSDCIVIMGSNMAEAHPVGFQWVVEAKEKGAKVFHIDPRFTRTSALADQHLPLRAGSDIAFLGGIVNYILENGREFREYVTQYTNAPVIIHEDFKDTEDLEGFFSGFNEDERAYIIDSWAYAGTGEATAGGEHEQESEVSGEQAHGAHGMSLEHGEPPEVDHTLQHPRCVFQLLKKHFSRYTPEMVEQISGVPKEKFLQVAEALCQNSGRERTSAIVYSVGWTQHTVGVQYIRTAAIIQLLLGNMGRPGGGILALRGHANIQGSTDIPTLFNILPGYIPMPHPQDSDLETFVQNNGPETGAWGELKSYMVSFLRSWWGQAATEQDDWAYQYLPKIDGDHSNYTTMERMLDGKCPGYFVVGENPAVGNANGGMNRKAMSQADWVVVRDFQEIESASWWYDGPEIKSGAMKTEEIKTEVFFFPAAAHTEKDGSFTNTQRLLQWHYKAVEPREDCRSDLHFFFHLGRKIRERLAGSTQMRDRPVLDLTWDYPTVGPNEEPDAEVVLMEIGGVDWEHGGHIEKYQQLRDDGTTTCGSWIHAGIYKHGVNQTARKTPHTEQNWIAHDWGWAWPGDRRILYNRASADPDGKPWSERKKYIWWDEKEKKWTSLGDEPDIEPNKPPDFVPPRGATGIEALGGSSPFILHPDGLGWLFAPAGLVDGPMPTHYEPQESPFENPLYKQGKNPTRQLIERPENPYNERDKFPFVLTTYRLTEHHTAGGMSRTLPFLSELQPELFVEISPELAADRGLEHLGWATISTARTSIEAKVMVTDRMKPIRVMGDNIHQVGLPYHWGWKGLVRGDVVNDLLAVAMDPNVHIQESKAATCDIRPGRRGPQ
jgi:formate dehydrogenase major subunit